MKLEYEAPVAEIEVFETEDVLAISIAPKGEKGKLTPITWDDFIQ